MWWGRTRGRTRTIAWAVAYALVVQLILASALAASLPLAAAGDFAAICGPGTADHAGDDDYSGRVKAVVHCPLCLLRADSAILPPPVLLPRLARLAEAVVFPAPAGSAARGVTARVSHHPRGPPTRG